MRIMMELLVLTVFAAVVALAQPRWQHRLSEDYDVDEVETINGMVDGVNSPRAIISDDSGIQYEIHMGPVWFWDRKGYQLKEGVRAELKGWLGDVKGSRHFYPKEIRQDGNVFVLRDGHGIPEWSSNRNPRDRNHTVGNRGYGHRGYRQACSPCGAYCW